MQWKQSSSYYIKTSIHKRQVQTLTQYSTSTKNTQMKSSTSLVMELQLNRTFIIHYYASITLFAVTEGSVWCSHSARKNYERMLLYAMLFPVVAASSTFDSVWMGASQTHANDNINTCIQPLNWVANWVTMWAIIFSSCQILIMSGNHNLLYIQSRNISVTEISTTGSC